MKICMKGWFLGLALMAGTVASSAPPQQIQKLDPKLDAIVPAGAKLERVATGFDKWTEGPVWTHDGSIFLAEIPANNIVRWTPSGGATVFLHPSGYTGAAPYKGPEPGSNAMTLDSTGRLTVAGHARRNVWRLESARPESANHDSRRFLSREGTQQPKRPCIQIGRLSAYFTDPPYGLPTQGDNDPEKQLKVNGVYRIPNASRQKPGAPPDRDKLQLVIGDLARPNGIALSPDEKYLYIAESGVKQWLRYRVMPDGSVTDKSVLFDPSKETAPGTPEAELRWIKRGTCTVRARAACGSFRPKENISERLPFRRSWPI